MTDSVIEKKSRPAKKIRQYAWKTFSSAEYQQAAQEMVHFSAKTVNSNTISFGIRLSADRKLDLPYVAASTIDRTHLPMDYTKNIGKPSTAVKQINAARHNRLTEFEPVPEMDQQAIKDCAATLAMAYEPEAAVGIRLRQIILQDANGNDIAATPLPCAGLSTLINARIQEESERENSADEKSKRSKDNHFIRRKKGYLGVGGSNPQNVGLNVRAMQKPLLFKAPSIIEAGSQQLRQALAIYYKGITHTSSRFKLNTQLLSKFIVWRQQHLARYFIGNPTNLYAREQESHFLIRLTQDFMYQIAAIQQLLQNNLAELPEQRMYSSALPMLDQALLDSSLRDMQWRRDFAAWLHRRILNQSVWVDEKKQNLGESIHATAYWIGIIEGVLA